MKKVIDGKIYNTKTADLLCEGEGGDQGSFNCYDEALYRTKHGAYFIAGEGGPMTHYAQSAGQNSWTGGSGLRVVTEAEAREFVERHGDSEKYEAAFGAPEEG